MAETPNDNCAFCSDPILDGEATVYQVNVWRDSEEAVMPALVPTGSVAHRKCATERSMNEEELTRFKRRFEELARTQVVILEVEPLDDPPIEIPGQEKLFDGNP